MTELPMPQLKEIFEMATNKVDTGPMDLHEQERRQRRSVRTRKIGAVTAVAAILVVAAIAVAAVRTSPDRSAVGSPPTFFAEPSSLMAIDIATGTATTALTDVASFRAAPSHDGTQIAFVRTVAGHGQIFVAASDGSGARQVTGRPGQPGCACEAIDPAWSPDDSEIAFSGTDRVGNHNIYVVTLATFDVRAITRWLGDTFEMTPAWSPDGSQIAFAAGSWQANPAGSGAIYVAGANGGKRVQLAAADGAIHPTWSPDGTRIAYSAYDGLWSVSAAAGGPPQRLTDGADDSAPAWAPDGATIAFTRGQAIAMLDLAAHEVQILGLGGGDPAWSGDGSTLYAWHA
jgi:Tol biopolymer transport system component